MPDVMLYLADGSACRCHWDNTALIGEVRVALLADQDRKIVRIMPIHDCKGIGIASPKGTDPAGYPLGGPGQTQRTIPAGPRPPRRSPDRSSPWLGQRVSLAPGMKPGVNLAEPAELDACIDLGRGDRGVAEHFLDDAEIGAPGEKVGGEAVPERMRADVGAQAARPGMAFDDLPEGDSRQADGLTSRRRRRWSRVCGRPAGRAISFEVGGQCRDRVRAERNLPLLVPLADAPGRSLLEIQVDGPEPDDLRGAAAGRVQGLQDGAVATA